MYIHIYIHTYIRNTYIHTYLIHSFIHSFIRTYIVANRCFKCSRFNHRFRDCRGEETCPLCAGNHKLKECTATPMEYKCINCLTYNKHNQNKRICDKHSSLDKNCPSLQAVLEKYRQNTDY